MDRTKILLAMQDRRDLHYLAADQYHEAGCWRAANIEYAKAAGISEAITIYIITRGEEDNRGTA